MPAIIPDESFHNFGALKSVLFEPHKIRRSTDFVALNLRKGSSGILPLNTDKRAG